MAERRTSPKKNKPRPSPTVRKVTIEVIDPSPPSELRGLLPTPPEVEEMVEQMCQDYAANLGAFQITTGIKKWITERIKMQYYFGGNVLVYRDTRKGREVLAVGSREIRRYYRETPYGKQKGAVLTFGGFMVNEQILCLPHG